MCVGQEAGCGDKARIGEGLVEGRGERIAENDGGMLIEVGG